MLSVLQFWMRSVVSYSIVDGGTAMMIIAHPRYSESLPDVYSKYFMAMRDASIPKHSNGYQTFSQGRYFY
jgi:hypothetical protein